MNYLTSFSRIFNSVKFCLLIRRTCGWTSFAVGPGHWALLQPTRNVVLSLTFPTNLSSPPDKIEKLGPIFVNMESTRSR